MDCSKWEELGLLYGARELGEHQARDFEEHLVGCEECKKELYMYREAHERFFSEELLGEAPSPAVDAEILRVCSNPRKRFSGTALFPALWRKILVPVALLFIGFISAGYIAFNMQNARHIKSATASEEKGSILKAGQQTLSAPATVAANESGDSLKDSIAAPKINNFAGTRGNIDHGVITVDLKKDKRE